MKFCRDIQHTFTWKITPKEAIETNFTQIFKILKLNDLFSKIELSWNKIAEKENRFECQKVK